MEGEYPVSRLIPNPIAGYGQRSKYDEDAMGKETFDEFKRRVISNDPALKRSSDAYLYNLYKEKAGSSQEKGSHNFSDERLRRVVVTTEAYPPHPIARRIDVISAECALGINVVKEFFVGLSDFFGGRSETMQKSLRDARLAVLAELRAEAVRIGADGVIGVSLSYSQFTGKGTVMLVVVAVGTAVEFAKAENRIKEK